MGKPSVLLLAVFLSFTSFAKVFVVSDIDDTIKKANSANGGLPQAYHFFKKKVYPEMRDLFVELKTAYEMQGEEVEFIYVSAAPDIIFNQQRWLNMHGFPAGSATLRNLGSGDTYTYKMNVIKHKLKGFKANDSVYFFGDNASKDAIVYRDTTRNLNIVNSYIYIRDVTTRATPWIADLATETMEGINFFFSEREFLNAPEGPLFFISERLRARILKAYNEKTLIPAYTYKQLNIRLLRDLGCRRGDAACIEKASDLTELFWFDYYIRY